jgi:acyl carrier protein
MLLQPIGTNLAQDSTNSLPQDAVTAAPPQPELEQEVAALIVEALNLEIGPSEIDPEAPLFGEGLGLDSIDILEVALVVSKKYGFQLRSDDSNNTRIFQSLRSLCQHIALNRLT